MRNYKLLFVFVPAFFLSMLACGASRSGQSSVWQESISTDGHFRASFPGNVKSEKNEITLSSGEKQPIYQSSTGWPDASFVVVATELAVDPRESADQISIKYDRLRDGLLAEAGAKLVSEQGVSADGILGREVVVERPNQRTVDRVFIIGKRQFQVMSTQKGAARTNAATQGAVFLFLGSFHPID